MGSTILCAQRGQGRDESDMKPHSSPPYVVSSQNPIVVLSRDGCVADCSNGHLPAEKQRANAAFIATACTVHEELCGAVLEMIEVLEEPGIMDVDLWKRNCKLAIARGKSALKKAGHK